MYEAFDIQDLVTALKPAIKLFSAFGSCYQVENSGTSVSYHEDYFRVRDRAKPSWEACSS